MKSIQKLKQSKNSIIGLTKNREKWIENIRKVGLNNRKHFFNEDYFSVIDTPEKAYWLGFIQADGSIDGKGRFTFCLHVNDAYILEQFREDIGATDVNLNFQENKCRLMLSSVKLDKDLQHIGIKPRKSFTGSFPTNIDRKFINHYIRGCFDGDGTIYIRKDQPQPRWSIAGSEGFCNWVLDCIHEHTEIKGGVVKKHMNNLYTVIIGGNKQVFMLYEWLYKDATRWLRRKRDKLESFYFSDNDPYYREMGCTVGR